MNALMVTQYLAVRGDHLTGGVGQRFALVGQIGINELLVISAGHKTYLLRIRLFGQRQFMLPRQISHLGLGHLAQREASAAELLLGKTKEEISLVLGRIG